MRHRMDGRKLGRTKAHREALMRNLSTALIDKEKIVTTLPKAKELRRYAEKLVTISKKETLHARRQVLRRIKDKDVVAKLFDTLSARYAQRPGGYTRIIKLGPRLGDHAEMAVVEFVGGEKAAKAAEETTTDAAESADSEAAGTKKPAKKAGKKTARAKADKPAKDKSAGKKSADKANVARPAKKTVARKGRSGKKD